MGRGVGLGIFRTGDSEALPRAELSLGACGALSRARSAREGKPPRKTGDGPQQSPENRRIPALLPSDRCCGPRPNPGIGKGRAPRGPHHMRTDRKGEAPVARRPEAQAEGRGRCSFTVGWGSGRVGPGRCAKRAGPRQGRRGPIAAGRSGWGSLASMGGDSTVWAAGIRRAAPCRSPEGAAGRGGRRRWRACPRWRHRPGCRRGGAVPPRPSRDRRAP